MKRTLLLGFLALLPCSAAGVVKVWGGANPALNGQINSFYNTLSGTTSTLATGTLDTVDLTGVNLLWAIQPTATYTNAEVNAMAAYLATGGRLAFMGEHGTFMPSENNRINAALAALGSSLSIVNQIHDPSFRTASVGDGQILAHPLTAGVNSYRYAAYAPLTLGSGGVALMIGEDQPSIMMAYQNVGGGSIFLISDQNVFDAAALGDVAGNDNHQMFANLLDAPTSEVPEPSSYALLISGGVAIYVARRKR